MSREETEARGGITVHQKEGMVAGTLNASLCYLIYKRIERHVAPVSTYRTKQFTRTGYEVKDIDVVLCTIVFTCIYCIIRGVIEIGL